MKNVAASVRARLGNRSKTEGQTLDFLILPKPLSRKNWKRLFSSISTTAG